MTHTPRSVAICLILFCKSFASDALADDFKTIEGKEYKNVTVSRVEPDGIMLITKTGLSKVYFTELPEEIQERFHYNAAQATQFAAATQVTIDADNAAVAVQQEEEAQERQRRAAAIAQQQQQINEQQRQADATLVRQQQQWAQARHGNSHQQQQNASASQIADRERQRQIAKAVATKRARDRENRRNEDMQRQNDIRMQESRVDWARRRLETDELLRSPHGWIQSDRESYKREQERLRGQQNRATAY